MGDCKEEKWDEVTIYDIEDAIHSLLKRSSLRDCGGAGQGHCRDLLRLNLIITCVNYFFVI